MGEDFSPVIEYMTCGHIHSALNVMLVNLSQIQSQLRCHYCGYAMGNLPIVMHVPVSI